MGMSPLLSVRGGGGGGERGGESRREEDGEEGEGKMLVRMLHLSLCMSLLVVLATVALSRKQHCL